MLHSRNTRELHGGVDGDRSERVMYMMLELRFSLHHLAQHLFQIKLVLLYVLEQTQEWKFEFR